MDTIVAVEQRSLPPVPARADLGQDAAQAFVAGLRAAAPSFAAAAGARTAVVREVVPPARHRRSRCRIVFRLRDGGDVDVTFLGAAGRAGAGARTAFEGLVARWSGDVLSAGRPPHGPWSVPDADAPDGVAIDVNAWAASS